MPNGATSSASASENPSRANFVAEYAEHPANEIRPPTLVSCTIAPDFCARMCGS